MKKALSQTISFRNATWLLGCMGLTSLSLLNNVSSVNAASLTCGTGNNWVSTCKSGIYQFHNSVTNVLNFGSPNNQPDFVITRSGTTRIIVGQPVDAIVGDALLGDVGTFDGKLDVVKFEIFDSISTGNTPQGDIRQTFIIGDRVPDLAATPPKSSLYSVGAIVQKQDNPALADSFIKAFLEVIGEGEQPINLRIKQPIVAAAEAPLTSFPSSITYRATGIIPLFTPGSDGIFDTPDDFELARLVPDSNGRTAELSLTPIPVPEPSITLSSIFFGIITIFGYKRGLRDRKS